MSQHQNINVEQESDLQKIVELVSRNYKLFIISIAAAITIALLVNFCATPIYKISASILIKEEKNKGTSPKTDDFLNSSLFANSQNLQNELWVIKSAPVIEEAIGKLDLQLSYYNKKGLQYVNLYKEAPFKVLYLKNHAQPINVRFEIKFNGKAKYELKAKKNKAEFYNFENKSITYETNNWIFNQKGHTGQLIENKFLGFIIELDSTKTALLDKKSKYYFEFTSTPVITENLKSNLEFSIIDKLATVIEIDLKSASIQKGIDIINELMDVYSKQNLDRKNHLASITSDYIDKQLSEISDSLNRTEHNLQSFRSTKQLLNVTEQASDIDKQYRDLQNQKAELFTKKRYYDYVSENITKNNDYSNLVSPTSLGIEDNLLTNLLTQLITVSTQKSTLIQNKQDQNPIIKRLDIQIESLKKAISENIELVRSTTQISIDEMNKRIAKIESEISRIPETQRQLGGIERKYRLNDAIYNYLLEKRAEAKITQASNVPDNIIIEPAKMVGVDPVFPNKSLNFIIAILIGIAFPIGFLMLKNSINNKIESQESIERITDVPVLGKVFHNTKQSNNVVFDCPNSNISESFRALRTNLEYYVRGLHKKVIMVTSCIEGEGKSFNALNIAMSYAQLGRRTILLDFDLRKPSSYFNEQGSELVGLSSYLINSATLEDIIINSPNEKLDYISSGPLPPNPVELIALEKTKKLITQLKETYDYIIIDTPPLAQVTDGYLLLEHADIKVIITRYNFTLKKVFSFVINDLKHKNIENTCIVLNDNRFYRDQYGYGYGYNKNQS